VAKLASGVVTWYLSDRLSVRLLLDNGGAVVGRQGHLPFGEEVGVSGAQEKRRFTGYERDAESGTDYAVNRQYAPSVGRFMQADPYRASGGSEDPQSWNRYAYVQNRPLDAIDPTGLNLEIIHCSYQIIYHEGRWILTNNLICELGGVGGVLAGYGSGIPKKTAEGCRNGIKEVEKAYSQARAPYAGLFQLLGVHNPTAAAVLLVEFTSKEEALLKAYEESKKKKLTDEQIDQFTSDFSSISSQVATAFINVGDDDLKKSAYDIAAAGKVQLSEFNRKAKRLKADCEKVAGLTSQEKDHIRRLASGISDISYGTLYNELLNRLK
jgi:RHS repeat-associated protein